MMLAIAGGSGSGKTLSALRLAHGAQAVVGGEVFFIDTESGRALHYAPQAGETANPSRFTFDFRHVPLAAPFGPLDYIDAFQHCLDRGSSVIVCDSMTHEHTGPGGVMDQVDEFLERFGDDEKAREKNMQRAHIRPKAQRKRLNQFLELVVSVRAFTILCYRAEDKSKPVAGQGIKHIGWQPETTSQLHYACVQRFLLTPGCDGKPTINPAEPLEQILVKNPEQFRGWFTPGVQLDEELGRRLAEWARGGKRTQQQGASEASAAHNRDGGGSTPPPATSVDSAVCNEPVAGGRFRCGRERGHPGPHIRGDQP
jgi:hypothetical protein